jgi:16S rRNA A1518/A1519 N6-dimethyltransferase RsmA/KsgA/DIM1 with predicted DNA glycosylase/AP lyase activity
VGLQLDLTGKSSESGPWSQQMLATEEGRKLIAEAFAHRRKALAKSVALASGDPSIRDRLREALEALGLPADSRAEQLSAEQFAKLASEVTR